MRARHAVHVPLQRVTKRVPKGAEAKQATFPFTSALRLSSWSVGGLLMRFLCQGFTFGSLHSWDACIVTSPAGKLRAGKTWQPQPLQLRQLPACRRCGYTIDQRWQNRTKAAPVCESCAQRVRQPDSRLQLREAMRS